MFARLPLKSAFGAAALATAGLMLTPATASAQAYSYQGSPQPYSGYGQSYGQSYGYDRSDYGYDRSYDRNAYGSGYDYCRSDRRNRQGTGAAVGATFGAVLGSQLGARGRRTEGSVLGAVIGGALGAAVGNDSARDCNDSGHVQYGYGDRYRYEDRGYSTGGYRNYGYEDRYDDRGYQYRSDDGYRSDCRPVAVHSRDRYGRSITRYQQTC